MPNIILASKSKVREEILDNHNVPCNVEASNVDEEPVKESLLKEVLHLKLFLKTSLN